MSEQPHFDADKETRNAIDEVQTGAAIRTGGLPPRLPVVIAPDGKVVDAVEYDVRDMSGHTPSESPDQPNDDEQDGEHPWQQPQ